MYYVDTFGKAGAIIFDHEKWRDWRYVERTFLAPALALRVLRVFEPAPALFDVVAAAAAAVVTAAVVDDRLTSMFRLGVVFCSSAMAVQIDSRN